MPIFSATDDYSYFCCLFVRRRGVPLPLDAWERLCYFIAALPGPSIFDQMTFAY